MQHADEASQSTSMDSATATSIDTEVAANVSAYSYDCNNVVDLITSVSSFSEILAN